MDVVAFAVILVGLAAFVAAPLYRAGETPVTARPQLDTAAHREAADRAIEDLEVDRASGLVDEDSYTRDRAAFDVGAD